MQLNAYLFFKGNCEAAFKFYEKCLGGKIEAMIPHAGTPAEQHVPAEWRDYIALNAEMAPKCPQITERKEPLAGSS